MARVPGSIEALIHSYGPHAISEPPGGWLPDQRLKLAEALAAWTFGGAFAEHAEDRKGSLADGMLADIAVLDRDIVAIPSSDLAGFKVTATIVGGRVVHES